MKHILLMTDLSEGKDNLYLYALRLAFQLRSNLILSHDMESPKTDYEQSLLKLEKLKTILEEEAEQLTDCTTIITCLIEKGDFNTIVKNLVDELQINFIVMGASDGKNDRGYLFGNKVRTIVEKVNCQILLIPEMVQFNEVKNILYVTDIRYSDFQVIAQLTAIAKTLNAQVSILHVCADGLPDIDVEAVNALFVDTISSRIKEPLTIYKSSKNSQAESAIDQLMSSKQQGILAVAHRKYHFFNHLFTESPSKEAAIYKQMPLLLMPVS